MYSKYLFPHSIISHRFGRFNENEWTDNRMLPYCLESKERDRSTDWYDRVVMGRYDDDHW